MHRPAGTVHWSLEALRIVILCLLAILAVELLLRTFAKHALVRDPDGSQTLHRALFQHHPSRLEHLRPDLQILFPPRGAHEPMAMFMGRTAFEIRTNRHGMRMRAIERDKPDDALRIAVLGDSVTFGWRVPESETYPRRLEVALRRRLQDARIEVLNYGVPGYTSLQGIALLREEVLAFEPDVAILAFGFNDFALRSSLPDWERIARRRTNSEFTLAALWWLEESALARAANRLFGWQAPSTPSPRAHRFNRRVPRDRYLSAMVTMIDSALARKCEVVLANLCFPHARAGEVLDEVAELTRVPLLDGRKLFMASSSANRRAPEETLPLSGEPACTLEVRVTADRRAGLLESGDELLALAMPPEGLDAIADLQLVPLAWRALDGGTGVYRASIALGAARDWAVVPRSFLLAAPESLERLSHLHYHRLPAALDSQASRLRVEFGQFLDDRYLATDSPMAEYLAAEAIHPNARGHALLARRLEELLMERCEVLRARRRAVR